MQEKGYLGVATGRAATRGDWPAPPPLPSDGLCAPGARCLAACRAPVRSARVQRRPDVVGDRLLALARAWFDERRSFACSNRCRRLATRVLRRSRTARACVCRLHGTWQPLPRHSSSRSAAISRRPLPPGLAGATWLAVEAVRGSRHAAARLRLAAIGGGEHGRSASAGSSRRS